MLKYMSRKGSDSNLVALFQIPDANTTNWWVTNLFSNLVLKEAKLPSS